MDLAKGPGKVKYEQLSMQTLLMKEAEIQQLKTKIEGLENFIIKAGEELLKRDKIFEEMKASSQGKISKLEQKLQKYKIRNGTLKKEINASMDIRLENQQRLEAEINSLKFLLDEKAGIITKLTATITDLELSYQKEVDLLEAKLISHKTREQIHQSVQTIELGMESQLHEKNLEDSAHPSSQFLAGYNKSKSLLRTIAVRTTKPTNELVVSVPLCSPKFVEPSKHSLFQPTEQVKKSEIIGDGAPSKKNTLELPEGLQEILKEKVFSNIFLQEGLQISNEFAAFLCKTINQLTTKGEDHLKKFQIDYCEHPLNFVTNFETICMRNEELEHKIIALKKETERRDEIIFGMKDLVVKSTNHVKELQEILTDLRTRYENLFESVQNGALHRTQASERWLQNQSAASPQVLEQTGSSKNNNETEWNELAEMLNKINDFDVDKVQEYLSTKKTDLVARNNSKLCQILEIIHSFVLKIKRSIPLIADLGNMNNFSRPIITPERSIRDNTIITNKSFNGTDKENRRGPCTINKQHARIREAERNKSKHSAYHDSTSTNTSHNLSGIFQDENEKRTNQSQERRHAFIEDNLMKRMKEKYESRKRKLELLLKYVCFKIQGFSFEKGDFVMNAYIMNTPFLNDLEFAGLIQNQVTRLGEKNAVLRDYIRDITGVIDKMYLENYNQRIMIFNTFQQIYKLLDTRKNGGFIAESSIHQLFEGKMFKAVPHFNNLELLKTSFENKQPNSFMKSFEQFCQLYPRIRQAFEDNIVGLTNRCNNNSSQIHDLITSLKEVIRSQGELIKQIESSTKLNYPDDNRNVFIADKLGEDLVKLIKVINILSVTSKYQEKLINNSVSMHQSSISHNLTSIEEDSFHRISQPLANPFRPLVDNSKLSQSFLGEDHSIDRIWSELEIKSPSFVSIANNLEQKQFQNMFSEDPIKSVGKVMTNSPFDSSRNFVKQYIQELDFLTSMTNELKENYTFRDEKPFLRLQTLKETLSQENLFKIFVEISILHHFITSTDKDRKLSSSDIIEMSNSTRQALEVQENQLFQSLPKRLKDINTQKYLSEIIKTPQSIIEMLTTLLLDKIKSS